MPTVAEQTKNLPRHGGLDNLLAHADDPHPRRTRRIEWVGQVSPLDNPIVSYGVILGMYTDLQVQAIYKAAAFARTRGHGHRKRLFECEHQHAQAVVKGLHRTYIFEESNGYVCDVDYHDVDILLGGPDAAEFRDLDDPKAPPDPHLLLPREDDVAVKVWEERVLFEGREGGIIART